MREVASRSIRRPELAEADRRALRHQHAALDRVIELADVARPRMLEQRLQRRRFEAADVLAVALRVLPQEVRRERGNVLAPLAQRRQLDLDRVQPEQQVLPEAAGRDLLAEVRVGRRDDAHVDLARARRADALEVAGLEHAQQLRLQVQRHVRDLVEEQRAAVGELEAADAIGLGVGEGALHVAEQLALEDAFGEAAGVDGDEPLAGAAGHGVNRLRDRALAGAVLAGDEHVGFRRADARDQLEHRPHRRRFGDEHRPDVRLERAVLGFEPLLAAQRARQLDLRAHDRQQPRVLPRLLDEVARAAAHGLDRHLDAAPGGHHDDRQGRDRASGAATAGRALPGPRSCRARS